MAFSNSKKLLRTTAGFMLSFIILLSSALLSGCTEDEANAWLNEIFGALNYEISGDSGTNTIVCFIVSCRET